MVLKNFVFIKWQMFIKKAFSFIFGRLDYFKLIPFKILSINKKYVIAIYLLLLSYLLNGQVPNGNFEQWNSFSTEYLNEWVSIGNVQLYTNSHNGNYAVKIEQYPNGLYTSLILHGEYVDGLGFVGGMPYNERPDSLKGFFKCYTTNPAYVSYIYVVFKNNGSIISEDFFFVGATPDTVNFHTSSFKINYTEPQIIPDSVIIMITSPHPFQEVEYGGYIVVDDLSFVGSSTPINNGGFEDWDISSFDYPNNWISSNLLYFDDGIFPVEKTTDSYSGSFAAKIGNIINVNDTISGFLISSQISAFEPGAICINDRYTSLSGHYKYFPENGDTMLVFMLIYKNDSVVGNAFFTESNTVHSYSKFDIPIFYNEGFCESPDSALIFIMPSMFNNVMGNSVMFIDDLELIKNNNIVINEFVSSNTSTHYDFENDAEDWIEIYNAGSSPVNMINFFISDNESNPFKWRFFHYILEPDSFMILFASGKDHYWPQLHTNFKISSSGENLVLSSPLGDVLDFIPAVELPTNVSYGRFPDASSNFVYFSETSPLKTNNFMTPYDNYCTLVPQFSLPGGFYSDSIFLSLYSNNPAANIYYTLDGSIPNENSLLYNTPILIKQRDGEPNLYSNIQTAPDIFWNGVPNEVFKSTPVRARIIETGTISLNTVTNTYFVHPNITNRYNLPIWSLVTDPKNLFDYEKGIYVPGKLYDDYTTENPNDTNELFRPANYFGRGQLWERDVHAEFFKNTASTMAFSQNLGLRIHGGASRMFGQKSLRLYCRSEYGKNNIDYPIIPHNRQKTSNLPINNYKRLILRNSGNDYYQTMFRDGLIHSLVSHTRVDIMAFQPSIVFINGEYWGIHNIRERQDKYYLNSHYNINEDDIVILETIGYLSEGKYSDTLHYRDLINYVKINDISNLVHFDNVSTMMDMDNFIDYQIIQIYINNQDWPGNNIKYWRERTSQYNANAAPGRDGKWRWLLYDTDFGFGLKEQNNAAEHNTLEFATMPDLDLWPNPDWATFLLRNLLLNEKFKTDFINRMADHINTSFKPHRVQDVIDSLKLNIELLMPEQINRWFSNDIMFWHSQIATMEYFANNRASYVYQHVIDKWNLSGNSNVILNVSDKEHGKIKISSIVIDENTKGIYQGVYPWTGKYFNDVIIPVEAIANPGYKFVKWEGTSITNNKIFITLNNDTLLTALFELDTNYIADALFINEFMAANNSTIADSNGNFEDWIEIYNAGIDTVDIASYYISDSYSNIHKHRFVFGYEETKIPPGGFLLIWADDKPVNGPLHVSFKLSANGERIILTKPDGISIVDSLTFGSQTTDVSYGRYPDGNSSFVYYTQPTPGATNILSYISENYIEENIMFYPNPTKDIITFSEMVDIKIYNIKGQLVCEQADVELLNVTGFDNGIYFIRMNDKQVKKLLILKQ